VRNPALLRLPNSVRGQARSRLTLVIGDIHDVQVYAKAASEADCAVLLACSWGGPDCHRVNVEGTLSVVSCLKRSAQVIYASSAALVTADGLVGKEALATGSKAASGGGWPWGSSDYLKSKASALAALSSIASLQCRLTVVYPSLILGPRSRRSARASLEVPPTPRPHPHLPLYHPCRYAAGIFACHQGAAARACVCATSLGTMTWDPLLMSRGRRAAAKQEAMLPRLLAITGLASSLHFIHPRDAAQVPVLLSHA